MSWRGRILDKLNSMPEPSRTQSLLEFEKHEYFSRNARKHNCLIEDVPHPAMKTDDDGNWVM